MKIYYLPFLIVFFIMIGCSGNDSSPDNCQSEIIALMEERGPAEKIERYDEEDYHRRTYWYWRDGYSKTFEWGKNVDGCVSNSSTFPPMPKL